MRRAASASRPRGSRRPSRGRKNNNSTQSTTSPITHCPRSGPGEPRPTWSSVLPSTFPPAALAESGDLVAGPVVGFLVAPCSFVRAASLVLPPDFPTRGPDWRKFDTRRWLRFRDLPWPLPGLPPFLGTGPHPIRLVFVAPRVTSTGHRTVDTPYE